MGTRGRVHRAEVQRCGDHRADGAGAGGGHAFRGHVLEISQ